jgi:hypothetical protein
MEATIELMTTPRETIWLPPSLQAFHHLAELFGFLLNLLHTLISPPRSTVFPRGRPSERPDPVLEAIKFFSVQEGHFSRDWEEPDLFELLPRIIEELFCAVVSVACALHDVPGGHFAAECVEEDVAAPV